MADVTIGGRIYSVSLPNFRKLKAAWGPLKAAQASADPMDGVEAILGLVAVGSATAVTLDELEDALTPAEIKGLRPFVDALMVECGMAAPKGGESGPLADPASPSTETSIS